MERNKDPILAPFSKEARDGSKLRKNLHKNTRNHSYTNAQTLCNQKKNKVNIFTLQTDMSATLGNDSAQQIAKKALTTVGSDTNKSGQESPNPNRQDIININVINGGPTNKLGDFRNITNTSGMSNNTNNRYSNVDAMANRHMNSHD